MVTYKFLVEECELAMCTTKLLLLTLAEKGCSGLLRAECSFPSLSKALFKIHVLSTVHVRSDHSSNDFLLALLIP